MQRRKNLHFATNLGDRTRKQGEREREREREREIEREGEREKEGIERDIMFGHRLHKTRQAEGYF